MRRRDFLARAAAVAVAPAPRFDTGAMPFPQGVASFDPGADRVLLWTRVATDGPVRWVVARDRAMTDVVGAGTATTAPATDHTITVSVDGLAPATTYWYRFAASGADSPVGRTRTLPQEGRLRIAAVSCARYATARYGVYRALAAREVDVVLHLGDYIYENAASPRDERPHDPPRHCVSLSDYRARYAQARSDPDLRRLHARHAMAAVWDDHDIASNAWRDGAMGHDSGDGEWGTRRDAAIRARREWVPWQLPDRHDRNRIWRTLDAGDLARIVLLDTRIAGRLQPVDATTADRIRDPAQSMLGADQREWLLRHVADPDPRWLIVGNQVMFNPLRIPVGAVDEPDRFGLVADGDALVNPDQWDGYAAERDTIVRRVRAEGGVVVVSGDIHSSWAFAGPNREGGPSMVEAVVPSVSSSTLGGRLPGAADVTATGARLLDPTLEFVDLSEHGYVIVDLTPERAQIEWWFADPDARGIESRLATAFTLERGTPARLVPTPTATVDAVASATRDETPDEADDGSDVNVVGVGAAAVLAGAGVAAAVALRRRGRSAAPP